MIQPVRLQLSRKRGFRLQAVSRATNGLPAVLVARRSRWGNPWRVGLVSCSCRSAGECGHNTFCRPTAAEAIAEYRAWLGQAMTVSGKILGDTLRDELRGRNLACWCKPGAPCHADVLLELANR
jgi:hypothetical protein